MQVSLRIKLFGIPRIQIEPSTICDLPTQKAKFLFYYLLLFHENSHVRETLETLFWGDHPEPRARRSLSTELWRLRRWIEPLEADDNPLLSTQEGVVRLRLADSWSLDTLEFEQCLAKAQQFEATQPTQAAELLHHAVQLYSGELLEGCYYDWCFAERERLHQAYLDALLKLMVYHGARREYAMAIECGKQLLRIDPLQEQVHRELMKLYVLNQQQPQALAQYQTCVQVLHSELGIAPDLETQAIMRQVMIGQVIPTSSGEGAKRALSEPSGQIRSLAARVRLALGQIENVQRELQDTLQALEELQVPQPQSKRSQVL